MTRPGARKWTIFSEAGSSMAEVMVTVGIVASVMSTGVLSIDRGYLDLATAKQNLINDLRRARMQATLKATHFRFEAEGNHYVITRLEDADGDGAWQVDEDFTPREVALPAGFHVSASKMAEFDGRGMLVDDDSPLSLDTIDVHLKDHDGQRKTVQIWPSGQVEELVGASPTAG